MHPNLPPELQPTSIHDDEDFQNNFPPMHPYFPEEPQPTSIHRDKNFQKKFREVDGAIRRRNKECLRSHIKDREVNLSGDPLLCVLIAYKKADLTIELLKEIPEELLHQKNLDGDTALHMAAMVGDVKVALALIKKNKELLHARNLQLELPIHKAALYGDSKMFWLLEKYGSDCSARREDGATVLHCAIMGNAPGLALEIARKHGWLMTTRNSRAVTPLQLVVTIPDAFRSKLSLGPLETLIYAFIPVEDSSPAHANSKDDVEKQSPCENYDLCVTPVLFIARWIRLLLFRILKQCFARVEVLEKKKENHKEAMRLVAFLAEDPDYWDFIVKGSTSSESTAPKALPEVNSSVADSTDKQQQNGAKTSNTNANQLTEAKNDSDSKRWDESPLTLGAKMGLHEFVEQILKVCPQSALYPDTEKRNILQVAVMHGQERIVEVLEPMITGPNSKLPSWLRSRIDLKTKNTILHFAAEKTVREDAGALQMQTELQWFERVKKLVPKDLRYSRNESEKTAHELFTEKHTEMVKDAKDKLMALGGTCSSLLAAVVFASSFSIPGDKDQRQNPVFYNKVAFKVFSHTYVIGLSAASSALVLFLSLLTSTYRQQDFRRSLPTKYFLARISFFVAFTALLVAFSCNIYLSIYGGRRAEIPNIAPFVCELTVFPAVCCFVLLWRGSTFGLTTLMRHLWR